MREITITINTENAAFTDFPQMEVARILGEFAAKVESMGPRDFPCKLFDSQGNSVGKVSIK